jgi:NAD(P)H dehydrogenase (quinone)
MMSIIQCMLIYGMMIVGDPMDASGHYGVGCHGAPDETAANDGFKLGKRVAQLCARIQD